MRSRLLLILPLLVFLLLAVIGGFTLFDNLQGTSSSPPLPSALINQQVPNAPIPNFMLEKANIDLKDYEGQPLLVNFFASWCLPCRTEMPLLEEISEEITIIGISYKDKDSDTAKFLERYGNPFSEIGRDHEGRIGISWGVYGIPETYLIDAKGQVLMRHAGALERKTITETFRPLWEQE